ncbi:MAG: GNAT family N-acetyltransferase [Planctomycetes bacterium]|nr:GNAT family N-acetyltransferase [Planctomycetota bacterium]
MRIETDRLCLRELTSDDLEALFAVLGDREALYNWPKIFTREEVAGWIERSQASYEKHGHGLWAVVLKSTGECIGDCGIVLQVVEGKEERELGYHLQKKHWGNGYATEAGAACMEFAFRSLKRDRIISLIMPHHTKARGVAERLGMRVEREVQWKAAGAHLVHVITREEYERSADEGSRGRPVRPGVAPATHSNAAAPQSGGGRGEGPSGARPPLAEFHLHLEAALSWGAYVDFLRSDGAVPPVPEDLGRGRAPWLESAAPFADFEAFRTPWQTHILPVLKQPGMYARWVRASVRWLAGLGVRYAELNVGGPVIDKLELPFEETARSIADAFREAERETGVRLRFFLGLKRGLDPSLNARLLERWMAATNGAIHGVDLHSYEQDGPCRDQKPAYELARSAGLHLRTHAGEHAGPEEIRDAIDLLGVESINHGVRAVEDPGLVRELAARRIPLHVCPTSNVLLGVAPTLREHPLRRLLEAGVVVTLNSDDPLLFGTDVRREYEIAAREMGLGEAEMGVLHENARRCSESVQGRPSLLP